VLRIRRRIYEQSRDAGKGDALFHQRLIVRAWTPQHEHATDLLNGDRAGLLARLRRQRVATGAIRVCQFDLDQPVGGQRPIDFRDDGRGETGLADLDDRLECVRACLEQRALPRGQRERHGLNRIAAFARLKPGPAKKAGLKVGLYDP
jgi:hypothetical protein